jgi:hypothetical protein
MRKGVTILILMSWCALFVAQELHFSRNFEAIKKNVPVMIINSEDCFYVLRYSKAVHDFTIERRAKPSAEIIGFTPLKMDSVNASWFNYENLDYLLFEHHKKLYFVFEKVTNTRRTIYLKIIDTLSKSSGFIELANLEKEKSWRDFSFTVKLTAGKNILIVASQTYFNGSIKKTAFLYNPEKRSMGPAMKLPLENPHTGYSSAFECNSKGDLFYVLSKLRLVSLKRKYIGQSQVEVPVFFYDTISLVSYLNRAPQLLKKVSVLANISQLNSIRIRPGHDSVMVSAHVAMQPNDSSAAKVYFVSQQLHAELDVIYSTHSTALDSSLEAALTFYDGGDYKTPGDKEYSPVQDISAPHLLFGVSERRELNYRKELLVWESDRLTGRITGQYLVPRKMFGMGFTPYNHGGEAMLSVFGNRLHVTVLEAGANFKKPATEFRYHRFKKVSRLSGANIVMYTLHDGIIEKKLVYKNGNFELVPLIYSSSGQPEMIFYLNGDRFEKFATWPLNPS